MTSAEISEFRKKIGIILREIGRLATRCLYPDPLIRGTPQQVFRRCGKATCKCMKEPPERHGPYMVISVFRNGRQRQIPVGKDVKRSLELAKHYQSQMGYLSELKGEFEQLLKLVAAVIEKRIEEFPT